MDMNAEHLKAIGPEINLDYDRMMADPTKGQGLLYLDEKFSYLNQTYQIDNLIIAGWLLTKHWSDATQATELWHIMNPYLVESVPQKDAVAVLKKVMYVGIDLN